MAWLTEADVDLQSAPEVQPILEEGALDKEARGKQAARKRVAFSGGVTS